MVDIYVKSVSNMEILIFEMFIKPVGYLMIGFYSLNFIKTLFSSALNFFVDKF